MRALSSIFSISFLLCMLSSCAYMKDRGRDATDIFTFAVEEKGLGVGIQAGPFLTGLGYAEGKGYGLRSGVAGRYKYEELNALLVGGKTLRLDQTSPFYT